MNSKQFLVLGGIVLILVGVLGYLGVIGPGTNNPLFGEAWWFDNGENLVHTLLGIVALIAAFAFPASLQKPVVIVVGLVALFFSYYSFAYSVTAPGLGTSAEFYGSYLQNPADTILHLVVGVWALFAALRKDSSMAM